MGTSGYLRMCISAPSGFVGRTKKAIPAGGLWWWDAESVNDALEPLLHVPTTVLRLISATSMIGRRRK